MALIRYNRPTSLLQSLHDEMNRMFLDEEVATTHWNPHVDVKEQENEYRIVADIPGVDPNQIDITLEGNVLTIKGERTTESNTEKENFSRIERFSGNFYRQFTLPDNIDSKGVVAKGKNGVLNITIPKLEGNTSKSIKVICED